jgi:hypothetical protein
MSKDKEKIGGPKSFAIEFDKIMSSGYKCSVCGKEIEHEQMDDAYCWPKKGQLAQLAHGDCYRKDLVNKKGLCKK